MWPNLGSPPSLKAISPADHLMELQATIASGSGLPVTAKISSVIVDRRPVFDLKRRSRDDDRGLAPL
jgi:hypothetical protein